MPAVAQRNSPTINRSAKSLPPKGLVLRCIIFQNGSKEYTAECVDLDILVYGKTPDGAWRSLKNAISGYLDVAFSGDPTGLVPRPSPLSHRARYHYYALKAGFTGGTGRNFLLNDWAIGSTLC